MVDDPARAHYIDGSMRQRVPRQPSTKWWILLAAVLATAITWWQVEHAPPRPAPAPAPAAAAGDLVWIELDDPGDAGAR